MSSTPDEHLSAPSEDLLPSARIRLAALDLFGSQGFDRTTVRQIAALAGVSPGLVIHHFGSKHDLRLACDAYACQLFDDERVFLKDSGPMPSLESWVHDHPDLQPVMTYLVQCLRGGGEMADRAYQLLCSVSEDLLTEAESQGLVRLPADREAAIALLATWSAGLQILSDLFARRLGGRHLTDPEVMRRYAVAATELLSNGVLSPSYTETLRRVIEPSDDQESRL
ncbi:TetR/AcrR family transcriptional regulator [Acidipropionibacterium jensenii]|uniref:TetR/AcrR family transcriptional regulator n=1 Tax=Acidipropionibacterium jensenii TaxID=1749 RepID=UPI000BC33CEC|nr:TetR/AcrR family transcriptional regulator [Acidipropionibacterium jensenii]